MDDMKKCPKCGQMVKSVAKKCRYCGYWFEEGAASPQPSVAPQPQQRVISIGEVLTEGVTLGIANFVAIFGAIILWLITIWIPYLNVGTTIAIKTMPIALADNAKPAGPTYIFDGKYRKYMGEYFTLIGLKQLSLIPAYFFTGRVGQHVEPAESTTETHADEEKHHCSAWLAFLPIVLPIVLMALGSVASMVDLPEGVAAMFAFLGKPVIALIIAMLSCLPLLMQQKQLGGFYDITHTSLKTAGPIIFITAAGGVLGAVVVASGFVDIIKESGDSLKALGVVFPFLIAAILKSAQGSSTVAITTTASMMGMFSDSGSMMNALGFTSPLAAALVVMAIGAGAMTVSHANDSYFWVVTGFGGIKPRDGYRTMTLMTLIMGLTAIALIALAAAILL